MTSSVDVVYDACSLIHMWARWPSVHDGLAAAMAQVGLYPVRFDHRF